MLDANLVAQMVEQEIRSTVNQQVKEAVSQTAWLEELEQQIIELVKKFTLNPNINTFDMSETMAKLVLFLQTGILFFFYLFSNTYMNYSNICLS